MSSNTALEYHAREMNDLALEDYGLFIPEGFREEKDKMGFPMCHFEYWMRFVYKDPPKEDDEHYIRKFSIEWYEGLKEALTINRFSIWCINRFTVHGSEEWETNVRQALGLKLKIADVQHTIDILKAQQEEDLKVIAK